ncbi:VOC family protein [Winogradskyella sp. PE311]|uniref:VOC family protein n=1 Tax=Winogradskyella sp. PE311 TaxID=3366943 RepID=UPI0039810A77
MLVNNTVRGKDALNFYTSIFLNSEIKSITKYEKGEPGGAMELIKHGIFTLNGVEYMVSENNYKHAWSFSSGVSIFITCTSDIEIKALFSSLSSNGGQVIVPLKNYESGDYGFGKKFGWCEDKYGISWQLNLAE